MEELPAHLGGDVPGVGDSEADGTKQGRVEGDRQYGSMQMKECGTEGKTWPKDRKRIQSQGKEPCQDKSVRG